MTERQLEKLKHDVDKAWNDRFTCMQLVCCTEGKKGELYRKKFNVVNEKCWQLQEKLDYYVSDLVASDDEIEIRRIGNDLVNMYGIYLYGQPIKVGHIDYRGYHDSLISGDIGYFVDDRFNGHNYAYKSLILLSDFLFKNDIHDFYISVFLDNISSLKIILKAVLNYGGSIIRVEDNMATFQCKTRLKTRINKKKA